MLCLSFGPSKRRVLIIVPAKASPGHFFAPAKEIDGRDTLNDARKSGFVLTLSPKGPIFGGLAGAKISLEKNERTWLGEH
jgi:hypothetical protein